MSAGARTAIFSRRKTGVVQTASHSAHIAVAARRVDERLGVGHNAFHQATRRIRVPAAQGQAMPLTPNVWNVIAVGRWNRGILTPQYIVTNLFKLAEGTKVEIEVPVDSIGPYRVKHDGVVVMANSSYLLVEATKGDYASVERAMRVACEALGGLPYTPVDVAGWNIGYQGLIDNHRLQPLVTATELVGDKLFKKAGYEVTRRDVTWSVDWNGGRIAVGLTRADHDTEVALNFNFERPGRLSELMRWLQTPVEEIRSTVERIAADIFSLPPDVLG